MQSKNVWHEWVRWWISSVYFPFCRGLTQECQNERENEIRVNASRGSNVTLRKFMAQSEDDPVT